MYISQLDLIKAKLRAVQSYSISAVIKDLISTHEKDPAVIIMKTAVDYYADNHDILKKDFTRSVIYHSEEENGNQIDSDTRDETEVVINPNNSNHHNVHNYFRQLVDQEADYIAGDPPAVVVEGAGSDPDKKSLLKTFEDEITKITSDELFAKLIADTIVEARTKGCAYWHPYIDSKGALRYIVLPAEEVIAVYDTAYQTEIREFLRYYKIAVMRNNNVRHVNRVEWWTADDVTYFIEDDSGEYSIEQFPDGQSNPAPHWQETMILDASGDATVTARSWGRVPLIEIVGDKTRSSLLRRIKGLQDAYNLLSSKLTNDEIDLVALFWVIQGYGGESASKIRKKLEMNKGVSLDDPDGKIDAKQVDLNTSERIQFLDSIKKDIFSLGEGLIPDMERSGNINTVELKMRYAKLNMKAKRMVREIKVGLKSLFEFIVEDMNNNNGTGYDSALIKAEFHFDQITSDTDTIDNILKLRGLVPDTILMSLIPYVDDPNQAWIELQAQKKAEAEVKANAYNVPRATSTAAVDGKVTQAANSVEANSVDQKLNK